MSDVLAIGAQASATRRYGRRELTDYAALGGARDGHGRVPPPLIDAMFSQLLGVELPGLGTNYLKQQSRHHGVARAGEALTAQVTITRLRPDKRLVDLRTTCRGEDGRMICDGRALVYVGDVAREIQTDAR